MNPYAILAMLVAWFLSLAGVGAWQRHDGHLAERSAWQTKDNEELRSANATILRLEERNRQAEHNHAQSLAAISADYERKLSDANEQRKHDRAAVRAGTLRLRDPGPAGLRACGSFAAPAVPGAGGGDGGAPGYLSGPASEFLLELANDADDVARQLAACQQVVIEDRRLAQ